MGWCSFCNFAFCRWFILVVVFFRNEPSCLWRLRFVCRMGVDCFDCSSVFIRICERIVIMNFFVSFLFVIITWIHGSLLDARVLVCL